MDFHALAREIGAVPALAAFAGAYLGQRVTRRKIRKELGKLLATVPCLYRPTKTHAVPATDVE